KAEAPTRSGCRTMTIPASSERSIFEAAIEKETPAERDAYLDQMCAGNPRLRQEVDSLLAAHDRLGRLHLRAPMSQLAATGEFTPLPANDQLATAVATHSPGTRIGPYKLLEQIGEGGMGLVFVAEQLHPVKRRVALKIIKPG